MASNTTPTNSSLDALDVSVSSMAIDTMCSICLTEPISKKEIAFANNCLHSFCFSCLCNWAKVKVECPLCKQQFTSILHNVKENQEYEEYKVPIVERMTMNAEALGLMGLLNHLRAVFQEQQELLLANPRHESSRVHQALLSNRLHVLREQQEILSNRLEELREQRELFLNRHRHRLPSNPLNNNPMADNVATNEPVASNQPTPTFHREFPIEPMNVVRSVNIPGTATVSTIRIGLQANQENEIVAIAPPPPQPIEVITISDSEEENEGELVDDSLFQNSEDEREEMIEEILNMARTSMGRNL